MASLVPDERGTTVPAELLTAIEVYAEGPRRYGGAPDDPGFVLQTALPPPPARLVEMARRLLPELDAEMAPVQFETLRSWLSTINVAVRNSMDQEQFEGRVRLVAFACGDVPGRCFSSETIRVGLRRWTFFPSAAEVVEVVEEAAGPMRRRHQAVLAIARGLPARGESSKQPRKSATQAELDHVSEMLASFRSRGSAR